MKKTLFFVGLTLTVFACNPNVNDEDVLPFEKSTTGGDDEDPIIQGDTTLVGLIDWKTNEVLDFTLTDENSQFEFELPRKTSLVLRIVCPDGTFKNSKPFDSEEVPATLTI